jgi:hypothetical protein
VNRRAYLAGTVAGAAGLAGCGSPAGRAPTETSTATDRRPLARRGSPSDICERDVVDVDIVAISEPAYGEPRFDDDHVVVGIERDGHARAYPLSVLAQHEVVNDVFPTETGDREDGTIGDDGEAREQSADADGGGGADGTDGTDAGTPLLVTYCPSCNSGMVAERRLDGEPTRFGVAGQVWAPPGEEFQESEAADRVFGVDRNDPDAAVGNYGALVLYDAATGSYWSQLLARAICGPARGASLSIVPSTTARWGAWRREHPDTKVLQPFPDSAVSNPPGPGPGSPTGSFSTDGRIDLTAMPSRSTGHHGTLPGSDRRS